MTLKDLQTYLKSVDVVNPSIIDSVISQIKLKNALNDNVDYDIDELRSYILKADVPNNNVINSVLTEFSNTNLRIDKNTKGIFWVEGEGIYFLPYELPLILNELNIESFFKKNHLSITLTVLGEGEEPFSMSIDENNVSEAINQGLIMSAGSSCQMLMMIMSNNGNLSDASVVKHFGMQKQAPQCSGFLLPMSDRPGMDLIVDFAGKLTTGKTRMPQNFNNQFTYLYDDEEKASSIVDILKEELITIFPDIINGYPVKSIDQLLMGRENLTQVVFPKFLEVTTSNFLDDCINLNSIVLKNSLKRINSELCAGCTALKDVYYEGTEAEWNQITIAGDNSVLLGATRYYYSETQPAGAGNYWHYVDNVPTKW